MASWSVGGQGQDAEVVTFDVAAAADRFLDALAVARRSPEPVTVTSEGSSVAVLLSVEAYEGLLETVAFLSDPETAAILQRAAADAAARHAAETLRRQGVLIGIPAALEDDVWRPDALVYPAFQIDEAAMQVHPVVAQINRGLGADRDPWGAASWWVTPDPRLGEGRAPMHLVGTDREGDLRVMRGGRLSD